MIFKNWMIFLNAVNSKLELKGIFFSVVLRQKNREKAGF